MGYSLSRCDDPGLERIVLRLAAHLEETQGSAPDITLVERRKQRWSTTVRLAVETGTNSSDVFVKWGDERVLRRTAELAADTRPRLAYAGDHHGRIAYEIAALRRIQQFVESSKDDRWFAVRVFDVGLDDALFAEFVKEPTLAQLMAVSGRKRPVDLLNVAAEGAGALLRSFHDQDWPEPKSRILASRAELADTTDAMIDFIAGRSSAGGIDELTVRIRAAVRSTPAEFPTIIGHGDFAAHNVFVSERGEVAVFDTVANCAVPRHLDLAYFLVMLDFDDMRRRRPRFRHPSTDGMRAALIAGYGDAAPPLSELRAFEIAVLVEKWASLYEVRRRSMGINHVKRARAALIVSRIRRRLELHLNATT